MKKLKVSFFILFHINLIFLFLFVKNNNSDMFMIQLVILSHPLYSYYRSIL